VEQLCAVLAFTTTARANLALALSAAGLVVGVLLTYWDRYRRGRIVFPRPSYVAVSKYNQNVVFHVPICVYVSGGKERALRFKAVGVSAPGYPLLHHQLEVERTPLPGPNSSWEPSYLDVVPTVAKGRTNTVVIAGFVGMLSKLPLDTLKGKVVVDVWWQNNISRRARPRLWRRAFRLVWRPGDLSAVETGGRASSTETFSAGRIPRCVISGSRPYKRSHLREA